MDGRNRENGGDSYIDGDGERKENMRGKFVVRGGRGGRERERDRERERERESERERKPKRRRTVEIRERMRKGKQGGGC